MNWRFRAAPELILILEQVRGEALSLPVRLRLLCRLERAVVRVSAVLAERRVRVQPPVPDQPAGLSLEQRLYAAMVWASVHLLHELDHGQGFLSLERERRQGRVSIR